jgi:hypothetical protein
MKAANATTYLQMSSHIFARTFRQSDIANLTPWLLSHYAACSSTFQRKAAARRHFPPTIPTISLSPCHKAQRYHVSPALPGAVPPYNPASALPPSSFLLQQPWQDCTYTRRSRLIIAPLNRDTGIPVYPQPFVYITSVLSTRRMCEVAARYGNKARASLRSRLRMPYSVKTNSRHVQPICTVSMQTKLVDSRPLLPLPLISSLRPCAVCIDGVDKELC